MATKNNPFASRFIRPGALDYHFSAGQTAAKLAEQFTGRLQRRAAIVGPHGSGKSTLLHTLIPHLGSIEWTWDAAAQTEWNPPAALCMDGQDLHRFANGMPGARVLWLRLSKSSRDASPLFAEESAWDESTMIVIDGYEQLRAWDRIRLWRGIRNSNAGLLVTCHYPLFFYPTLLTTEVTEDSAEYVVRRLLSTRKDIADRLIRSDRWKQIRSRWQNNLREALFELYDLMETSYG
ncbi:MAG: hypothetical protein U0905_05500 [Pirellulales bacterium]